MTTDTLMEEMAAAGAHVGSLRSRRHPSVAARLYGWRHGKVLVDLDRTKEDLLRAERFVSDLARAGKKILFVGNKPEVHDLVRRSAESCGMPWVARRWVGGTLTNFGQIRKRIARYQELEAMAAASDYAKYTKQERARFEEERGRLLLRFEGILTMPQLPGAILVVDSRHDRIAVAEACLMQIPTVSLSGTDCDISRITYPVVANDASRASVEFFLARTEGAIRAGFQTINDEHRPDQAAA